MTRVLVTGAAGFIARGSLARLAHAGHEVHAVSSRPVLAGGPGTGAAGRVGSPALEEPHTALAQVRWHRADLLGEGSASELMRAVAPTHLLHMAWCTEPGTFWTAPENLDWAQASLRLLRAFAAGGGRRAVIAGTCTEYEWRRHTHCVEERGPQGGPDTRGPARQATPRAPHTLYGAAKHAVHLVAERYAEQAGFELAWGRVFYTYGPHEHPARLASSVASALVRGEQVRCTDGAQVRDYTYVAELGEAFAALLDSPATGAVNMASGEPVRVADLVLALAAAAGRPELVRLGALPRRPDEPERLTADVGRLREQVGWSASVGLREGAERTVEWWRRELAPGASGDGRVRAGAGQAR
ncbi:MAG TPA: NAD(P)-dependent oxidoreductase [Solirubrobacteraceae bacterium]|nr:NAD(P)-dependent oxidoreductase [Solirubrobacteraceae bacterium]